jgi:hypothetical protein
MKIHKAFLFLTFFTALFSSCQNFFEMSVELDVPEHKSKLAVSSFIQNENEEQLVLVSYSVGGLEEPGDNQLINNANVVLQYDDVSIHFSPTEDEGLYSADTEIDFSPDEKYTLQVSAPNYETIFSTQTLPKSTPILEASLDDNSLKIQFQDDPDKRNFYLLQLMYFQEGNWYDYYLEPFGSTAYWSITRQSGIIFNDDTFNGNLHEVIADYYGSASSGTLFKVKLYSITEDYYRFDRSLSLSQDADGNPFSEPVILHRNIENGYGIFAMLNKSEFEFIEE